MLTMRVRFLFVFLFFICQVHLLAQKKVFGKVTDVGDNPLIGVAVYLNNTSIGTTTDDEGEFELTLKDGAYDLIVSYLGYETIRYALTNEAGNKELVLKMKMKNNVLDEIVLSKIYTVTNSIVQTKDL